MVYLSRGHSPGKNAVKDELFSEATAKPLNLSFINC